MQQEYQIYELSKTGNYSVSEIVEKLNLSVTIAHVSKLIRLRRMMEGKTVLEENSKNSKIVENSPTCHTLQSTCILCFQKAVQISDFTSLMIENHEYLLGHKVRI